MEIMHGLITGAYGDDISPERQNEFFQTHLGNWMEKFFEDLEKADSSYLYSAIATIGRMFVQIESDYFKMSA
jgi:TorA maturation chaperone TorD